MGSALRHVQIGLSPIRHISGALEQEYGCDPAREIIQATGMDMSVAVEVNALHRAVRERLPNGVLRNIELAPIMRHAAFP